jgi:steroid delta-isomerase-like uncharacterized protein
MNSTRTPREVAEAWFGPMWNNRDTALMRELMAPGAIGHLEGGLETVGPEGFEAFQNDFLGAVPDLKLTVINTLADGDDVCIHWTATGTHTGTAMGMVPSDAKVDFQGVTWLKVQNGQIVEGWDFWNKEALIQTMSGVA